MTPLGRRRWAVAEGYVTGASTGPAPAMTSHETLCLLNVSDRDAHLEITILFADREPLGPYRLTVPARHTGTCAPASSTIPRRSPSRPITRRSSSLTCPSSSSTRGSIHGSRPMPC